MKNPYVEVTKYLDLAWITDYSFAEKNYEIRI